jgi:hypothetical protein
LNLIELIKLFSGLYNRKVNATDILNSFDKDGKLLMNLGLEVSPYWLKSHPDLTRDEYLNTKKLGQIFLQSLSLSGGTVKDSASGTNKLGAGLRFRVVNGHPVVELKAAEDELKAKATIINAINGALATLEDTDTKKIAIDQVVENLKDSKTEEKVISAVKKQAESLARKYGDSLTDVKKFLVQLIDDRDAGEFELKKRVSELTYDRRGFILEFAGAAGFNTDDNTDFEKAGVWANASYFVSPDDFFTLTARYMNQHNDTSLTNVDVGIGFMKKSNSYNISVESMFRWYRAEIPDVNINNQPIVRLDKDFTYRLAVQGSYVISKDISINLSIGKDFNSPFISGSGIFSILGLNYSLFSKEPPKLN